MAEQTQPYLHPGQKHLFNKFPPIMVLFILHNMKPMKQHEAPNSGWQASVKIPTDYQEPIKMVPNPRIT